MIVFFPGRAVNEEAGLDTPSGPFVSSLLVLLQAIAPSDLVRQRCVLGAGGIGRQLVGFSLPEPALKDIEGQCTAPFMMEPETA